MSYAQDLPKIKQISKDMVEARNKYAATIANILKLKGVSITVKKAGESCQGNPDFHKDEAPNLDDFTDINVITFDRLLEDKVKSILSGLGYQYARGYFTKNDMGSLQIWAMRHLVIWSGAHEVYNPRYSNIIIDFDRFDCSEKGVTPSSKVIQFRSANRDKILGLMAKKYEKLNESLYKSKEGVYIVVSDDKISVGSIPVIVD